MTHQAARDLFVDALYGELPSDKQAAFEEHLHVCAECSGEYRQLETVAQTMHQREREDLSAEDWKAFWNVLAANIEAQREPVPVRSRAWGLSGWLTPGIRLAAAAIIIFLVGIGIGRFGMTPDEVEYASGSPRLTPAEQVALREETMGYLERSKVLLLGIVNTDEIVPEPGQLSRQQEVSRMLVSEGGGLQERLSKSGNQQLGELVNDLEVLLLQIANLEIENDFPGLEVIRGGVDRKGILLKINVEQMKAMQRRSVPNPETKKNSSRSMI